MAERDTAGAQLARILELLPRASEEGGAELATLAQHAGVSERQLMRDLQEVSTRAYYHPAGSAAEIQVTLEPEQVAVFTPSGEFRRPLRINAREAMALGLGLRAQAALASSPAREELIALAAKLEKSLPKESPEDLISHFALDGGAVGPTGVHLLLSDSARQRRRVRISYLKSGGERPETRDIDPYAILAASGNWYLVGLDHGSGERKVFRVDRIIEATTLAETFEAPTDFDADQYVVDGRVYRADADLEVRVRYAPAIARFIEERGPTVTMADGSVEVTYRVADASWLVRHVLQHGAEAEVVAPEEIREEVVARLREAIAAHSPS